jgi:hypothetical protein
MVKRSALLLSIATTLVAAAAFAEPDDEAAPIDLTITPVASTTAQPEAANPPPPATPAIPALHHAPPAAATAHEPLRITAEIDHPQTIKRALLVYRTPSNPVYREVPFLRAADGYVAEVPGGSVDYPSIAYTIELEGHDGARVAAYATRAEPHLVDVPGDLEDARETALLERVGGRRSVFGSSGELVSFGTTQSADGTGRNVLDHWYRIEAGYTYRPLRTIMEFGVRVGMVRGTSPVLGGVTGDRVGLNYGAPFVVFRASDDVHLEGHFLTSVTEVGFSTGVGGAVHLGDYFGTKLVLGFETIATFGTRGYSRLDLVRGRVRVSPIVEVTDMPHANRAGVRLLTELAFDLGQGFAVAARGGYQARDFQSGGAGGGLSFAYAF